MRKFIAMALAAFALAIAAPAIASANSPAGQNVVGATHGVVNPAPGVSTPKTTAAAAFDSCYCTYRVRYYRVRYTYRTTYYRYRYTYRYRVTYRW